MTARTVGARWLTHEKSEFMHAVPRGTRTALCAEELKGPAKWTVPPAPLPKCRECMERIMESSEVPPIEVVRPRRSRDKNLPHARTMTQADAIRMLSQQTFNDAVAARWIKPRAVKISAPGGKNRPIYAVSDVQEVEDRILNGEYPGQRPGY